MECAECGAEGGTQARVEYADGSSERLPLCRDCEAEFQRGDFVVEVVPEE